MAEERSQVNVNDEYIEKYGFHEAENYTFKSRKGLDVEIVKDISRMKKEPEWMTDFRVRSYEAFVAKPMPNWGSEVLGQIDFNDIFYYIKPTDGQSKTWEDLPAEIKNTYDRLGIPEAEKKYLAGVGAQYESEVIYHSLAKDLESKGVIFTDTDSALRDHPELFREYFGTIIPYTDNKFAALNSAVWSGGSFIYVPKGVKIEMPLQAYFRINAKNVGQFERTLIIVDEGAQVHYVEGCTAPVWSSDSLHSAVVEIVVKKGGRCRYTTIQNWSTNVYNLVTKRAAAYEDATMEWVDGNLGCLAEGSTVTTPEGIKTIESLNVGDSVLSYDDKTGEFVYRRVNAKKFSGYQPVLTVSAGTHQLSVTANHPFYSCVYDVYSTDVNNYRQAYVRADQLKMVIAPSEMHTGMSVNMPISLPKTVCSVNVNVSQPSALLSPTWDIEVEGTGNFISQGFIVHNSKLTMKYPAVYLMEPGAHGEILSIAFAGKGQHQDAGGKVVHAAPNTSSKIVSKSISKDGGRTSYRGLLKVYKDAVNAKSNVVCDALLLDETSRSDTYPYIEVDNEQVNIGHEASVSKIGEEQLFYAMSRGVSEEDASTMVVSGFIEPLVKELPMEYAMEMNRLIALQMEGTVG